MMQALFILSLCITLVQADLNWTGNVANDFTATDMDPATGRVRSFGAVRVPDFELGGVPSEDVGSPNQIRTTPGWDIKNIYFQYQIATDSLNIGIECFGICGDADGDGDAARTSAELAGLGGDDLPLFAAGEGIAIAIDFDADVLNASDPATAFDYIIGVPAGQPDGASEDAGAAVPLLPCSVGKTDNEFLNAPNCFGLYEYQATVGVALARRFLKPLTNNGANWAVTNHNENPNAARPHVEWSVSDITALRALKGQSFARNNQEAWTIYIQGFAGSFVDAGIGEDFLPSQTGYATVDFPCIVDICDVCAGDGSTCSDCAGVPNGVSSYDACDVCGGDGTTCLDCSGTPNGGQAYDACDVCGGDGSSCIDCNGVANGTASYDRCDVCNGDSSTCLDCRGVANGPANYDVCDVCDGDGMSCLDCNGVAGGGAVYDACDICGGDGTSCFDCTGTVNGTASYDRCDICDGDNTSCADCAGIANGPNVYDDCDVCGGDSTTCLDCANQPNGSAIYDACDVCNGDGTTCLDCAGLVFGNTEYDQCDICAGDNTACVDCAGTPNGPAVVDRCNVCNGDGNSCLDCAGTPMGTAVYDTCDICNGDNTACIDCTGVLAGSSVYDQCDICNGDNSSCTDCAGTIAGLAEYDDCDVCAGDNSSCADCAGVPNGPLEFDECGVCNGDGTACLDCSQNCFSLARCYFPFLFERDGKQKFTFAEKKGGSCKNC